MAAISSCRRSKKNRYLLLSSIAVIIALPIAWHYRYQWEVAPNKYFRQQCEKIGGTVINKKIENVKGFLLSRRREKKDLIDRLRKHDIPDDPYHHTNVEARTPAKFFLYRDDFEYEYIEVPANPEDINNFDKRKFLRYTKIGSDKYSLTYTDNILSKYELNWKDSSNNADREFGVHVGVIEIRDKYLSHTLATHTGLMLYNSRTDRFYSCPTNSDGIFFVSNFVHKILIPTRNGME